MNYRPKYGYTQFKKDGSVESNEGFKDYVVQYKDYHMYFSSHMQTSSLRRVNVSLHTVTVAIADIKTGELLAEVTSKSDFGFLGVRLMKDRATVPVTPKDAAIEAANLAMKPVKKFFRVINIINENENERDAELLQRPKDVLRGTYEDWVSKPLCLSAVLRFTIRNPMLGVQTRAAVKELRLGEEKYGTFYRNTGISRDVKAKKLDIGAQNCGFGAGFKGGVFYTDTAGKELFDGPGKGRVKQYIKEGLNLKGIVGAWRPVGNWIGLHTNRDRDMGGFIEHGYGIDPNAN